MASQPATHESDPETPASKRRRRPALACRQCRRRKIRCDQNIPCGNCTKSKIDDCTYPPTHTPASRRAKPQPEPPRQRLTPHTPTIATAEATGISPPGSRKSSRNESTLCSTAGASSTVVAVSQGSTPRETHVGGSNIDALLARVAELERTLSTVSRDEHSYRREESEKSAVPARSDAQQEPRFSSQSSWMNYTCLHSKVVRTLSQAQVEETELHHSMGACKGLGRQINDRLTADPTLAVLTFGTRVPERVLSDELVAHYFRAFEGVFRVLHIPTFRAEYERYWQQPAVARDLFVLQLQVVMALGATIHEDSLALKNAASHWSLEAQTWLGRAKAKKKRLTFEELQLTCLLCLAEANNAGPEDDSWVDAGELMRRAMSLNLHRDPRALKLPLRQAEMHRRLWATILELNLLLSLQAGRPPLISSAEFDTGPPASLSDVELDDNTDIVNRLVVDEESSRVTKTTFQLALFTSFNLRLEIARRLNAVDSNVRYDELLSFHSELSKADIKLQKDLKECSRVGSGDSSLLATSFKKPFAEILFSRYFLAIHLPVLGRSIRDPGFHLSRRVSIAVAIRMAASCGILARSSFSSPRPELSRLFVNSAGIFRYIVMQAVFAIVLEFVTLKQEQRDCLGAFPVWDEHELLQHVESAQAWAEDRVRAGLTDLHAPCFIAACIAYAVAQGSESFRTPDEAIVEAALRSSERCRGALAKVAERLGALAAENTSALDPVPSSISGAADDWVGDLLMEGMSDGFAFDWAYQAGPGAMPLGDVNIGFMAL